MHEFHTETEHDSYDLGSITIAASFIFLSVLGMRKDRKKYSFLWSPSVWVLSQDA